MKRISRNAGVLLLLVAQSLISARAADPQPIVPLQFSFSDPGARSTGFGGAFVALADDATAAFSNPAGLVQLLKPEISIEGRHSSYSNPFTEGGRVEGLPSGHGIDSTVGLRTANSEYDHTGLSFLSVAYPRGKWSFALYRHELANLEFLSETQGLFLGGTDCCQIRDFDQRSSSDLDFVSYGLAGAYRISDRFNLGFGLVYHETSLATKTTLFLPDDASMESVFAPNSYLPERALITQTSASDGTDWTVTAGFLWRPSASWSIGGVYRQGLDIETDLELIAGEAVDFGVPPGSVLGRAAGVGIEFPEIYGLGFAHRAPDGRLTVSFQWDHVEYSSIAESLELDDQTIHDVDELHLGAEYAFLQSTPLIAVRFGVWWEPDHQIRATSDDPVVRALLPRGDDQMHLTAGLGVAVHRFQIDLGVDFADRVDALSLSAIYNF